MPDLTLDLRFLRYAMVSAEQGSFRRAALVLGVQQSTVSRRVQLLEHRLGTKLFERHRTGVRLTSGGERFLQEAAASAVDIQRAARDMHSEINGVSGQLRVGLFFVSLASGFLSELIAEFIAKHPLINLRIDEGTVESHVAQIRSGSLDLAFVLGEPALPDCQTKLLWHEHLLLALPAAHRLATETAITWDQLRDERFIITADGFGPQSEACLVKRLSSIGFRPDIQVHGVGRDNLLTMVAMGFGISLTTESTLGKPYSGVVFRSIRQTPSVPSSALWLSSNENPSLQHLLSLAANSQKARGEPRSGRSGGRIGQAKP